MFYLKPPPLTKLDQTTLILPWSWGNKHDQNMFISKKLVVYIPYITSLYLKLTDVVF